ncbi:MAG: PTS sugar transporter subunit IIB [Spirochaetes bacterium]|nr:PTS sugar transporter subunit IIB [Spirochaetota bacterium]
MTENLIVRIDDRLIHGQVVTGWVKTLKLDNIVVANDSLINDHYKIQVIKLAVPSDINLEFLNINTAAKKLKEKRWQKFQTILLIESPEDAYKLVKQGCSLKSINVGGLHYKLGRVQLTANLALNEQDKKYLKDLAKEGIQLEGRALPSDEAYNVIKMINSTKKKNANK